jgi:hypothetical protein
MTALHRSVTGEFTMQFRFRAISMGLGLNYPIAASALAFCAAGIVGCGSSSSASPGAGSGTPTFTEVYTTVLEPNCAGCHSAGGADSFLDFSTQANAYSSLVAVKASGPACGSSGLTRVVAGSASTSLLYEKVSQAKPPCGAQMPFDGAPLSGGDQGLIASWINGGATND